MRLAFPGAAARPQRGKQNVKNVNRVSKILILGLAVASGAVRAEMPPLIPRAVFFGNPVRMIKKIVDQGDLGELYYIDSIRINLGLFQRDVNVIWDLAPHDLSIIDYIVGEQARSISAWGCAHTSG